MKAIELTRGQTAPIRATLQKRNDADTAWIIPDFTGASVRLLVRGLTPVRFTTEVTTVFEDVAAGLVAASPTADQFAGVGSARGEAYFEVTYADGSIETFPKGLVKATVLIGDAIAA